MRTDEHNGFLRPVEYETLGNLIAWCAVGLLGLWIGADAGRLIAANWAFTTDDAYITLRYADNLANGRGIVWNPGEAPPVEGYSNFSYVLLGAAAIAAGSDPVVVFKIAGTLAFVGSCTMSFLLGRCWLGPVASALPPFLLSRYLGSTFWAASGLETTVYQFLVLASIVVFARALRDQRPARLRLAQAGLIVCLASLTRPEGPLIALAMIAALSLHLLQVRMPWRERLLTVLTLALGFALPFGAYFGWRLVHFERLLPNSVYCKNLLGAGDTQLIAAYGTLAVPYLMVGLAHNWRRIDVRVLALLLIPLAYALLLYGVDPIIGTHNRHALAAWALLLVPAVLGCVNLSRWSGIPATAREWVVAAGIIAWGIVSLPHGNAEMLRRHATDYVARSEDRADVGRWLRQHLASTDTYVVGDCGVIPYLGGAIAIDAFCLNNREMTEPPIRGSVARFIDRIYELRPGYIVVHSSSMDELRPRGEYGFYTTLVADPRFGGYERVAKFGTRQKEFAYWIYRRR